MRATRMMGSGKREAGSPDNVLERLPGLRKLVSSVKAVAGMPDYERYLEHRRACHAGEPVLSRREHYLEYLKRRYSGVGGRCC
jgi:uncharacterized short protein YbdD (DUF466 family)